MRVLFVNHTAAMSGAERALLDLLECAAERHELLVLVPDGPLASALDERGIPRSALPAFEPSFRLHPLRTPRSLGPFAPAAARLARIAKRFRPQLVYANTPRAAFLAIPWCRWHRTPLVVRAHEHLPASLPGRLVARLLARGADAICAVSRDTRDRLQAALGGARGRARLVHLHNGIDLERFRPDPAGARRVRDEFGADTSAALLVQVAQITPWKGQDLAIRCLAALVAEGFDAKLVLVGEVAFSGPAVAFDNRAYERQLRRLAAALGVADRVVFAGARDDVPAILTAADLTLVPSWCEPFGLVTVESMACGTPPLVSERGAGPELIADGEHGRLLPPCRPELWSAAAAELLRDRERLEAMGRSARAAASRFDRVRAALAMEELWRDLAHRA